MTTLVFNKAFSRPSFILASGLMLLTHGAFAGDPSGDAQAQARELLDRPVVHYVIAVDAAAAGTPGNARATAFPDAQESARSLLLGKSLAVGAAPTANVPYLTPEGAPSASAQVHRSNSDPQDAARRMILGLRETPVVAHSVTAAWLNPADGVQSPR
jgi:hypothetical protein